MTSIFSGDPYIFNSNPLGFSPAVPSGSCSLGLPRCLATHTLDERSVSWFGGESPATWPCWLYKYTAHGMYMYIYILLYIDAQYLGINQFTWNMGMGEMIWFRFVLKKDFAPPVLAQMIPVRVVGVTSCRSSLGSCTCPNCPASQITSNSVLS